MTVVTEICSELGYGVVDGVGGHTRCLRDGICPELRGGDIPSESEKVVEKGVPLQTPFAPRVLEHIDRSSDDSGFEL